MGIDNVIIIALLLPLLLLGGCAPTNYYINDTYESAKQAYNKDNYPDAVQYFNQFITDNPNNQMTEVAMYYLAESYRKSEQMDKAKETYQKVVDNYKTGFWVDMAKKDLKEINESMKK